MSQIVYIDRRVKFPSFVHYLPFLSLVPDLFPYDQISYHISSFVIFCCSGGGKSTTVRLIERLYDPDTGAIFLDGTDLRQYDSRALHRGLSIVSQEPNLYARYRT